MIKQKHESHLRSKLIISGDRYHHPHVWHLPDRPLCKQGLQSSTAWSSKLLLTTIMIAWSSKLSLFIIMIPCIAANHDRDLMIIKIVITRSLRSATPRRTARSGTWWRQTRSEFFSDLAFPGLSLPSIGRGCPSLAITIITKHRTQHQRHGCWLLILIMQRI